MVWGGASREIPAQMILYGKMVKFQNKLNIAFD